MTVIINKIVDECFIFAILFDLQSLLSSSVCHSSATIPLLLLAAAEAEHHHHRLYLPNDLEHDMVTFSVTQLPVLSFSTASLYFSRLSPRDIEPKQFYDHLNLVR
ncbi:hypothetical protein Tsp_00994 [Trichinella spiralis]|uniref:hypothetical protein n=1 Tax=Trichinella spiralis TaxID=6334 RepID=UPI0001EFBA9E|nr:hypothetical protein Tsp_00994 [Trichinella spiralis]